MWLVKKFEDGANAVAHVAVDGANAVAHVAEDVADVAVDGANFVAEGADRAAKLTENLALGVVGKQRTEIYNDTGEDIVVYSLNSDKGQLIAPGKSASWGCLMWHGMIMKPKSGFCCVGSFGGSPNNASWSFKVGEIGSAILDFIKKCGTDMWKAVVAAFKSAFEEIMSMLDFEKLLKSLAAVPDLGRMKSPKPTKVPDHYDSAAAKKGGFAGTLHQEVHEARKTVEKVRFAYYETEAGLLEVYEALNSPSELATEAKALSDQALAVKKVIEIGSNGNAFVKILLKAVAKVLGKGSTALDNSSKSLKKADKKLTPAKKKIDSSRDSMIKQKALKKAMLSANQAVGAAEQATGIFAKVLGGSDLGYLETQAGPMLKELKAFNADFGPTVKSIDDFQDKIRTYLVAVLEQKRTIVSLCKPATKIYKLVIKPVLDKIIKIFEAILNLPIIKQIFDVLAGTVNRILDEIWNMVCEWTHLDEILDRAMSHCNPFKDDMFDGMAAQFDDVKDFFNISHLTSTMGKFQKVGDDIHVLVPSYSLYITLDERTGKSNKDGKVQKFELAEWCLANKVAWSSFQRQIPSLASATEFDKKAFTLLFQEILKAVEGGRVPQLAEALSAVGVSTNYVLRNAY